MQGRKQFSDEKELCFSLSAHVPAHNFYRRLKQQLDLNFLYELTAPFYGRCGQQSIDPVVFFKLCLVGYLENLISDRKLIEHCSLRLDLLYFLDYQLDEPLPWHSTVSRTRLLLPESLFAAVFTRVLSQCVEAGLVAGHTQVLDSALIKANAAMDSLELKIPADTVDAYLERVRAISRADRKAKVNKASLQDQTISATQDELKEIKARNRNWSLQQDLRPGAHNKNSKYTSNKTHYSPVDPDARIAVKPGKARKLCYLSQLAVDTAHHTITHVQADLADKKDNQCLPTLIHALTERLQSLHLACNTILADTGYSSGENYALLEQEGITAFIPPHGTYKGGPEGFTYHKQEDYWLCPEGKKATFRKIKVEPKNDIKKKLYFTTRRDCKGCPLRQSCIGKSHEKKVEVTYYREEYERTIARLKTRYGRKMKGLRQSTVEPVLGTLINFMGLRKINTRGIKQAHKVMLLAATAYNLKKLLNFKPAKSRSAVMALSRPSATAFLYSLLAEKIKKPG